MRQLWNSGCPARGAMGMWGVAPELQQISAAATPPELWRFARGYYRDLGFKGLAYFLPDRRTGAARGFHVYHGGFGRPARQVYADYGEHDPVPLLAIARGEPLRWSHAWSLIEPKPTENDYRERITKAGLGDGYTLPVFGPQGRAGAVVVGNASGEALDKAPIQQMQLVAQTAHTRLNQLLPDRPTLEKPLSARELEILGWVARGKSNSVIARILDLSSATVDTYLRRIYQKLGVGDRTSAAVVGVNMGLIAT